MKKCNTCKIEKDFIEFNKNTNICKNCASNYYKEYRLNNLKKLKEYRVNWDNNNKLIRKEYQKQYKLSNEKKLLEYKKQYNLNNKEIINNKIKQKRLLNPLFKLSGNIRSLIGGSFRNNGYSKNSKTYEILGCTFKEFKQYLELQFTEGMNWDNVGKWHLDHIYPVSLSKDENELIKLNHYTNFQPLWAEDNIRKGNKII